MHASLTWYIRIWLTLQVALNLAAAWAARGDPIDGYGPLMWLSGIQLAGSGKWAALHLGFILGNLVMVTPAALAAAWRAKLDARAGSAPR